MQTTQENSLITLHYSIAFIENTEVIQLVNTFNDGMPATMTIGEGVLPSTLEQYLINKKENSSIDVEIENAFGMYNKELQQLVSQNLIKEHSAEQEFNSGDVVSFKTPQGQMAGIFMQLDPNGGAWFDFNHPLAGKKIKFIAKIISVL